MAWLAEEANGIQLPTGEVVSFPAGVSRDQAYSQLKSERPELFEKPSGFIPAARSTMERMAGALSAAPSTVLGGLGSQESLDEAGKIYGETARRAGEILPEPVQYTDIIDDYKEDGLADAASTAWTFAREQVGISTPYMIPAMVAGKVGASDFVAGTKAGRGAISALSRFAPALRAAKTGASAPVPLPAKAVLGAAFGVGTLAVQFFADNLERQYEVASDGGEQTVTPDDISNFAAAAAAGPQAAMDYIFIALTGGIGRGVQGVASQSLKQSLAATATKTGKATLGRTIGQGAVESLTEFPTELMQTVLERAQAGESISLDDVGFVEEMKATVAGTVPVIGAYGAAGTYRSHRANKRAEENWEKMSDKERRLRKSQDELRELSKQKDIERAEGIQARNEARWNAAKEQATRNNDAIELASLQAQENTPVEIEDVIEAADSRNILTDDDGFRVFVLNQTNGRTSNIQETDSAERRRIKSVLSGLKVQEYVEEDGGASMPMFTRKQFNDAVEGTRNSKSIDTDSVRKALRMGNDKIDKAVALSIVKAMESKGYAQRPKKKVGEKGKRPLRSRKTPYNESQYEELLTVGQENGRITQGDFERITNEYGSKPYKEFISDMRVRGDLPKVDKVKGVFTPITYQDIQEANDGRTLKVGDYDVTVEPSRGYFVRDANGEIVDGATDATEAKNTAKRLQHRSRTYAVKKDGQVVKNYKNKNNAKAFSEILEANDPSARVEVISNPPTAFSVDKNKSDGFATNERVTEENVTTSVLEYGFSPDQATAEVLMENRAAELNPGTAEWDVRSAEEKARMRQRLEGLAQARGLRLDQAERQEFTTPDEEVSSAPGRRIEGEQSQRNQQVLQSLEDALQAAGLTEIAGKVATLDKNAEAFYSRNLNGLRTMVINLNTPSVKNAKTPEQINEAVFDIVNHELIHAMVELDLFTQNEYRSLVNASKRVTRSDGRTFSQWAEETYSKEPGYTPLMREEEAVAEMYRQYFKDPEVKRQIAGKPRTLLERIQRFFERLVNSLQGIGFDDASSVIRQIGTVQSRSRGEVRTLRKNALDGEGVSAVQEFSARQRESGGERRQQAAEPANREEGERKPIVRYSIDSSQNLLDDDGNPSDISSLIENDGGYVDILDETGRSVGAIGANVIRQEDFEDRVNDGSGPLPVGSLVIAHQGIEEKDALGKGYGKRAFKKLADAFLDRGSMVSSDGLVSGDAAFIYRSLARDGYDVRVHPEAVFDSESDQFYIPDYLDPVLSVPFLDSNLDRKASDVTSLKEYPLDPDGNALYDGGVFVVMPSPAVEGERLSADPGLDADRFNGQTIDTPSDAMFALTDKATFDEETGVWSDFDFEYVEQSNSDYLNDLVNKHIPTEEQLKSYLSSTKPEKAGVISDYEDGKIVDLRIDIPFYTSTLKKLENGLYAVTAHEPEGKQVGQRLGTPIAYESMVKLKGPVKFGVNETESGKLFKGERRSKTTMAAVRGALDLSDQDADIRTRFPDDINEWVPVGMNPHKAVFFYDKRNGREIVEGIDAISVGNTVYTRLTDESYGPRTATEAFDSRLSLVETREEGESDADAILRQSVEGQDPSGSVNRGLTQTGEEYMKTPGFIPRVSIGKPVTADPDIMYSISRPIANGEREPIPLSPNNARRVEFNTDPERTSGNRTYDVIEASVSPPLVHKSLWESIKDVLTDRPLSWFRQKFIDKYEGIRKVVEKARELRGDDSYLLAGMDALKAAYLSDKTKGVAQEAITSGQLIYRDGITVVDTEKKGLVEILQPLFDIDQNLISTWHTWMIANREGRFEKEGRMVQMSAQERQTVFDNAQSNGLTELFESVNRDYQEWNGAVVDYMVATGVVNEQMGEIFKKYGDYIPFYREFEGEADERLTAAMQDLIGDELSAMEADGRMPPMTSAQRSNMPSSMFGSLTGVKPPRRAKGGDSMVVDPLTGIMRNLEAAVASGMKNVAATRVMDDAVLVGMATEVDRGQARADTHSVRMDGEDRFFDVFDPLLHDSLSGMHEGRIKYLNFFAAPAQFLREMVTRSPDFIMANLLRDSLSTWTTAGGTKPIVDTMKNFFGGENDSYNALKSAGIISGFDNSKTSKDLAKKFSNRMRAEGQTPGRKIPFWSSATKLWDWSGDVSTKSDAATRQSVYESVLQELLESGVSQGQAQSEAIYQAAEVINFSRRGNSALAKIITAVIPFMNARVQGLDLLYRAGTGKYSTVNNITRNRALIGFLSRASLLATTSLMYAGMIEDEDEYKSASPQVRDDNWIIPGFGLGSGFKIPVPFEIGFLFKTVPERVYHYYSGDQNYKQSVDAITRGVVSTLEFNPFGAQISKPAMEAMMNHSFYTGTSIVPWYLEQAEAKYQRRLSTNELASWIADTFNASPMKVEHVLRGYTGTLGGYILTVADWGMRELNGLPARPTLRADQMMVARRFLQSGEGSRGALSEWYEFRNSARGMLNAFNSAKKDGDIEKARRIFEENSGVISQKPAINQIDNMISKLRRAERYILLDQRMTPDEKAEAIKRIDVARNTIYEASKSVMKDSDLSPKFPFPFSVFNG
tara:strand:+ start:3356 stop:11011 length:7656 start_codon:yes stop_codon:yes gene_type:complete